MKKERLSFLFSGCRPRFSRLAASPLNARARPLTKSNEKERLLAVYEGPVFKCFVIYIVRNFEAGNS